MKDTFSMIIANNFDDIKKNFKNGLKYHGYKYDQDILADTFIKCNSALKDKLLTKKEAISYFWTSYINNLKRTKPIKFVELSEDIDIENVEYEDYIDDIYNTITTHIKEEYGDIGEIWIDYTCGPEFGTKVLKNKWNSDKSAYYNIKKIRRYIKDKLIPNDQELSEKVSIVRMV